MRMTLRVLVPLIVLAASAGNVLAQGVPTTQPGILSIFMEEIIPGMDADHAANEAGWPAAYAKADDPYSYLALTSMTGASEVWYISSYDSYAIEGQSMKSVSDNPELSAELDRLWRADAQYLNSTNSIKAIARPDLSYGAFPDIGLARYWDITTMRVRLGHEQAWEAAAKVYMEIVEEGAPGMSYRIYQVASGMSGTNFMIFQSVNEYADFDTMMASGNAMFEGANPQQLTVMQNVMTNDVQNVVTNRFRLSAAMSYVDAETKAKDPAFWNQR